MCAECRRQVGEVGSVRLPQGGLQALRMVLATALGREEAAWCLGCESQGAVQLWPSSLYGVLATAAKRSPCVWARCSELVESKLGAAADRYERLSPLALAQLFSVGRDTLAWTELAAILWSLLRCLEPTLDTLIDRLSAELEVIAARRQGTCAAERESRAVAVRGPFMV